MADRPQYIAATWAEVALLAGITQPGMGRAAGNTEELYRSLLVAMTAKVESLLEVDTLLRGTFTEMVEVPRSASGTSYVRLCNGFVVPGSVSLVDSTVPLAGTLQAEAGTLRLALPAGQHVIRYEAGFVVDETTRELQNVPAFLPPILAQCVSHWTRVFDRNTSVPEHVAAASLIIGATRAIHTLVTSAYERPRTQDMLWAESAQVL